MLREIQSDAFKINGEIRPKIEFTEGLNVVNGADSGTNSIGKSSFLMCIDFAFGGNDYVEKLKNIIKNVGDHDINFCFEFNNKKYYFSRNTKNYKLVTICNPDYSKTDKTWSIENFNNWLKEKYEIKSSLSFRQAISRHLRIYNRENLDEIEPLKIYEGEKEQEQIKLFIQLFNLYGPVDQYDSAYTTVTNKKKSLTNAQKFKYVPNIKKSKYNENLKRIAELEKKKTELAEKSNKNLLELDSEKADRISELKRELSKFRRQRTKLKNQLAASKDSIASGKTTIQTDFDKLVEFFPGVNIAGIKEIEEFHKELYKILDVEIKENDANIKNSIDLIEMQIKEIEDEINSTQTTTGISKVTLDEYSAIDKELSILYKENRYYDEGEQLSSDVKAKKESLESTILTQAHILETSENNEMERLNSVIFGPNTNCPKLSFTAFNKYSFITPDDDGTGTNYKGLIILDLATLGLTDLPAVAHDSYLLKQISEETTEKIFQLYDTFAKQIFVSIDRIDKYTPSTLQIIHDNEVLKLSKDGNELYGMKFGETKKND